jgi:hypothetical protein
VAVGGTVTGSFREALEVGLTVRIGHRVEQFNAGFESAPLDQVAVAYEADEVTGIVDYRQGSEDLAHQSLDRLADRRVRTDRSYIAGHHIADLEIEAHLADRTFAVRGDADLVHCDHAAGGESLDTRQ